MAPINVPAAPGVSIRPLPSSTGQPTAGPGAFGAPVAEALGQQAQALHAAAQQARENEDSLALTSVMGTLSERAVTLMDQASKRRGAAAVGVTAETLRDWDTAVGDLESRLTSPGQRQGFARIVQGRASELRAALLRHEGAQRDAYDETETAAVAANAIARAGSLGPVPGVLEGARDEIAVVREEQARRLGLPPEERQRRTAEDLAALHAAMLETLKSDPAAAQAYIAKWHGEIAPDVRNGFARLAATTLQNAAVFGEVDRIAAEAQGDRFKGLALVRKVDPAIRADVEQQLTTRWNQDDAAHKAQMDDAWQTAQEEFKRGGFRVRALSPETVNALPATGERSLLSLKQAEESYYRAAAEGTDPKLTLAGLQRLAQWDALSPDEKAKIDPVVFLAGRVPLREILSAVKERGAILQPPDRKLEGISWASVKERATTRALALGRLPGKNDTERGVERAKLFMALDRELEGVALGDGSFPAKDVDAAIERLLVKGTIARSLWFDPVRFGYQVGPEESFTASEPLNPAPAAATDDAFARWYGTWAVKAGLPPDPDDPSLQYDFRAAFAAGVQPRVTPEGRFLWPGTFATRGAMTVPEDPDAIPDGMRSTLEDALRAEGRLITEDNVRRLYRRWKAATVPPDL